MRGFPVRTLTVVALATMLTIAAVSGIAVAQKRGGVLRVGNLGEPPALDAHWTTASITETLTNHIYEGLYSLDANARPIPMLAESHTVSKDGLAYTFKLRQGIKFHNGKEMTSDDVVASLTRWGKQSVYGKTLFAWVAEFRTVDKYTAQMQLKEKIAIVLISLAVPQLRRHLSQGNRREIPARAEGHRVRRHRPVQARRVEARSVHPHGALRRLQVAQRAA